MTKPATVAAILSVGGTMPRQSVALRELAKQTGAALSAAGIGRPDRVAIENKPDANRKSEEIPKGATGKLQRIGLAEKLGLSG